MGHFTKSSHYFSIYDPIGANSNLKKKLKIRIRVGVVVRVGKRKVDGNPPV